MSECSDKLTCNVAVCLMLHSAHRSAPNYSSFESAQTFCTYQYSKTMGPVQQSRHLCWAAG